MRRSAADFKANESKIEVSEDTNIAIEEAREKMHKSILENGDLLSPTTIKLSQELDKLIVEDQLRRLKH